MRSVASDGLIGSALATAATRVESLRPGAWTFALMNGRPFKAQAAVDDDWLALEAALEPVSEANVTAAHAWKMLACNASLDGGVRLTFAGVGIARLCADIPLDADIDLGSRIRGACRGLEAAKARTECGEWSASGERPASDSTAVTQDELAEACRQTGWSIRTDGAGALAVDLDVPGSFYSATIESRDDGVTATVPLLDEETASAQVAEPCRRALAILLLRTSAVVRMVRATVGAPGLLRFEVPFGGLPSAAELAHALGALSLACRVAGREAIVLRHDERVADLYVRQWINQQREKED